MFEDCLVKNIISGATPVAHPICAIDSKKYAPLISLSLLGRQSYSESLCSLQCYHWDKTLEEEQQEGQEKGQGRKRLRRPTNFRLGQRSIELRASLVCRSGRSPRLRDCMEVG